MYFEDVGNSSTDKFRDPVDMFSLAQTVSEPTDGRDDRLDLVFHKDSNSSVDSLHSYLLISTSRKKNRRLGMNRRTFPPNPGKGVRMLSSLVLVVTLLPTGMPPFFTHTDCQV